MKKWLALALLACAVTAQAADKLVVGASPTPHADILEHIRPLLLARGVALEVKVFTDYIQPNVQLAEKRLDANFFQHKPFMDEFNRTRGTRIQAVANIVITPFGAYSRKVQKIGDLKQGATVAIPNDVVNGGRALQLLQQAGVIQLADPKNTMATQKDIVANPKKISLKQLDAPMLPRALGQVDLAIINTTFALEAGLDPKKDALFLEASQSLFINVLAARPDNRNSAAMVKLVQALQSPASRQFILTRFKGRLVPAF